MILNINILMTVSLKESLNYETMSRLTFKYEYELVHLPWYSFFRRIYLKWKIKEIQKIHNIKGISE